MVSCCKEAALQQSTSSGIKRFIDEQPPWFNQLFTWVKMRDSCQPEQAIEPSSSSTPSTSFLGNENENFDQDDIDTSTSSIDNEKLSNKRKL